MTNWRYMRNTGKLNHSQNDLFFVKESELQYVKDTVMVDSGEAVSLWIQSGDSIALQEAAERSRKGFI